MSNKQDIFSVLDRELAIRAIGASDIKFKKEFISVEDDCIDIIKQCAKTLFPKCIFRAGSNSMSIQIKTAEIAEVVMILSQNFYDHTNPLSIELDRMRRSFRSAITQISRTGVRPLITAGGNLLIRINRCNYYDIVSLNSDNNWYSTKLINFIEVSRRIIDYIGANRVALLSKNQEYLDSKVVVPAPVPVSPPVQPVIQPAVEKPVSRRHAIEPITEPAVDMSSVIRVAPVQQASRESQRQLDSLISSYFSRRSEGSYSNDDDDDDSDDYDDDDDNTDDDEEDNDYFNNEEDDDLDEQ